MDKKKEQLLKWLNDVYALELDITKTLEGQLGDAEDIPDAKAKIEEHIEVTKQQAERVKGVIEELGGDTSTAKSMMAQAMGGMKGMMEGMAPHDKLVKYALADYATEHMEIASYKSLIVAAEELGEDKVVDVCKQNLKEEEEMAQWLEDNIPELTKYILKNIE